VGADLAAAKVKVGQYLGLAMSEAVAFLGTLKRAIEHALALVVELQQGHERACDKPAQRGEFRIIDITMFFIASSAQWVCTRRLLD
jgi:hypothetical protein